MGLREKMNQNPAIMTGATAAVIVIALVIIFMQVFGGGPGAGGGATKTWYSTDDGATFFADDINKIPPFKKDGKDAYRAQVFTCDDGKTKFVAYLERYTPDAQTKIQAARTKIAAAPKDSAPPEIDVLDDLEAKGREVKSPKTGDAGWVKANDSRASKVTDLKCPNGGSMEKLEQVIP